MPTVLRVYFQGMFASTHIKNTIPQMSMVVERLWTRMGSTVKPVMPSVHQKYLRLVSGVLARESRSETTMISPNFANSEGWKVMPPRRIQRVAPLAVKASGLPGISRE